MDSLIITASLLIARESLTSYSIGQDRSGSNLILNLLILVSWHNCFV